MGHNPLAVRSDRQHAVTQDIAMSRQRREFQAGSDEKQEYRMPPASPAPDEERTYNYLIISTFPTRWSYNPKLRQPRAQGQQRKTFLHCQGVVTTDYDDDDDLLSEMIVDEAASFEK